MRRQLTLFVNEKDAENIEFIRKEFNPEQHRLIKCHVTLCREDEMEQIDTIVQTLAILSCDYVTINFGLATMFSNEKGVLLLATSDKDFIELRKAVLQNVNRNPKEHKPHITLMHPKNSICTADKFEQIKKISLPTKLQFKEICLIEQQEGEPWTISSTFKLQAPADKNVCS